MKQFALLIDRVKKREIKSDGDSAEKIRRRRDWSLDDFDAIKIRRSSSTKFDNAGVYAHVWITVLNAITPLPAFTS